jgi:thiosulfate dehydrogenase [quinone] large subunit
MAHQITDSKSQTALLVLLRLLIGWHLLYEGLFKLLHPQWSSLGFLADSKWILSGFAQWIISNTQVLNTVDALNTWGLIAIGLGLVLGLFTRYAAMAGTVLLLLYYFMNPPFIGMNPAVPMEGNYLVVNKTLIEAVAILIFVFFPSAQSYGLDSLLKRNKK